MTIPVADTLDHWKDINDALEELRYCLLGLPQIPESALTESYFGKRADDEIKFLRNALRRAERSRAA